MNRTICILVAIATVFTATGAPVLAADLAPLPDGFESESASTLPGLYAHGVDYHDGHDLGQSMRGAELACFARGRKLERSEDAQQAPRTEYWLYRSGNDTVVFENRYTVKIDVDRCQVTVVAKRNVSRSNDKVGAWPATFHGGRGCSRFAKDCYTATMFGIKVRCRAEGNGFEVTRHCVSIERGPTRGLLLESVYESDDMTGYGFKVTELAVDASLDASLFDRSRIR